MDKKTKRILKLAIFNRRFLLYVLILLSVVLAQLLGNLKLALLFLGISCLLFGLYMLLGYLLRWKSYYCTIQAVYRQQMTPDNVDWSTVKKIDALGVPIGSAVLGIALIIVWLIRG